VTTPRSWHFIAAGLLAFLWVHAGAWAVTAYSKADRVNVRSRPGFIGEIVTQLKKGQAVTVLDTVTLKKPAADEPPVWMKIELPPDSPAWASADFVDPATGRVKGDLLNVRAGPTYDHGIVARAKRGTTLKILAAGTNGWVQVAAPAGSIGFVPAAWLADSAAAVAAMATHTPPSTTTTAPTVRQSEVATPGATSAPATNMTSSATPAPRTNAVSTSTSAPAPAQARTTSRSLSNNAWLEQFVSRPSSNATVRAASAPDTSPSGTQTTPAATSPTAPETGVPGQPSPTPAPESLTEPAVPEPVESPKPEGRWVRREGVVVRPVNITAPSFYALKLRDSGGLANFLIAPQSGPDTFREYRGRVVIVTGREYLDRRSVWRNIPLLEVETIEAVR
jgi:uncharacterized protein YgiM (DUF1202 family)